MKMGKQDLIKAPVKMKIKGLRGKTTEITEGKIKDRYGYIPKSVWDITKSRELMDIVNDKSKERYRDGSGSKPLSEFNPDVAKRCLQIWSKKGDKVLDPFMNRGTTSIMAAYFGRIGYANELVESYYENVVDRKMELIANDEEWAENIHLNNGDACYIWSITQDWGIEEFDYIYTSPPYWNVEKYESANGQLSDISEYEAFLEVYGNIIGQLHRVLKTGGYCTFVVNDFRRKGEYVWFSGDTITLFQQNGFKLHDFVINVVRTPHVSGIDAAIRKQQRTLKYHEYVITFKKD